MKNNLNNIEGRAIGLLLGNNRLNILSTSKNENYIYESMDGFSFNKTGKAFRIDDLNGSDLASISDFSVNIFNDKYIGTYLKKNKSQNTLCTAVSDDGIEWNNLSQSTGIKHRGIIAPDVLFNNKYVLYHGDKDIYLSTSPDLIKFKTDLKPILSPNPYRADTETLGVHSIYTTDEGILLFYYRKTVMNKTQIYSLDAALFKKSDPRSMLWQINGFWTQPIDWIEHSIKPLGSAYVNNTLVSYWFLKDRGVFAVPHSMFSFFKELKSKSYLVLNKYHKNPILSPIDSNPWESQAVFNPTAIHDKDKTHLLYRAVGQQYLSTVGYATSIDGLNIDQRLNYPVYVPREPFEGVTQAGSYNPKYVSGPGWGGCEDPRITKIDDRMYLTYVAFDGMNPPRVALSSISEEDFHDQNWNWDKPQLISKPGVVNKNAAVLPEKIKGKYVIFHRVFPHILIDYVDSLNFPEDEYLVGHHKISPRDDFFDSRKVGVGPTPIKTKDGWLLIYHSVDDRDDSRYKVGAMLLDLDNPARVIARTTKPILEPTEWYENGGYKAGVAYPCGATIVNDRLNVYYGGSDSLVCVATAPVNDFLAELKADEPLKFSTKIDF